MKDFGRAGEVEAVQSRIHGDLVTLIAEDGMQCRRKRVQRRTEGGRSALPWPKYQRKEPEGRGACDATRQALGHLHTGGGHDRAVTGWREASWPGWPMASQTWHQHLQVTSSGVAMQRSDKVPLKYRDRFSCRQQGTQHSSFDHDQRQGGTRKVLVWSRLVIRGMNVQCLTLPAPGRPHGHAAVRASARAFCCK